MKRKARCGFICGSFLALGIILAYSSEPMIAAPTSQIPEIWYASAPDAPDYLAMFAEPGRWAEARRHIGVFAFGEDQLMTRNHSGLNSFNELVRSDAFRLLRSWGLRTAIGVPAIKEWDCRGKVALARTRGYIENVRAAGGAVDLVALDEPLISGTLPSRCKYSVTATAALVAEYLAELKSTYPEIEFGDIEGYPTISVENIKQLVRGLGEKGVHLAFFHLDVNIPALARAKTDLEGDVKELRRFCRQEGIKFGVIVWSGYNPVHSDQAYYQHALEWAKRVRATVGIPDQIIMASWVTRSSVKCTDGDVGCRITTPNCGPEDPEFCGKRSVPLNLSDHGTGVYGLTRLVEEAAAIFAAR